MLNEQFKIKSHITKPVLSLKKEGSEVYIEVVGKMYIGKPLKNRENEKPATLCDVIDLTTGEVSQIVVPAVLRGIFEEIVESGDNYVGRCYWIRNNGKKESSTGQRYNMMNVAEIEKPNKPVELPSKNKKSA